MTGQRPSRSEIDGALADQLLQERGLPELAHLVVLGLVFLLVRVSIPVSVFIPWAGAVIGIVSARAVLWGRARRLRFSPEAVALTARMTMPALGLAWGLGTAVAARYLPTATLAVLLMALAGLLSGGIATLVADRWVFPLYSAAMLGPVLVGVLLVARERFEGAAIALIVVFLVFVVRLHRQAHTMLVERLQVEGELRHRERQLAASLRELQASVAEVKILEGILPICSSCKRIRTHNGTWEPVESYVRDHTNAEFSHGLCPDCAARDWGPPAG